jgi:hypothetical protein
MEGSTMSERKAWVVRATTVEKEYGEILNESIVVYVDTELEARVAGAEMFDIPQERVSVAPTQSFIPDDDELKQIALEQEVAAGLDPAMLDEMRDVYK